MHRYIEPVGILIPMYVRWVRQASCTLSSRRHLIESIIMHIRKSHQKLKTYFRYFADF